ncbi:MAG: hypothetical protein Q4A55_06135 [Aerococcus sp.]|nr:hypothetical protein [Aerococcus sp.]
MAGATELKRQHKLLLEQQNKKPTDWEKETKTYLLQVLFLQEDKGLLDEILNLIRQREVDAQVAELLEQQVDKETPPAKGTEQVQGKETSFSYSQDHHS